MTARIMIDLDRIHPVVEGRWHRVFPVLTRLPATGDPVSMLCGRVEAAEYVQPADGVIVQTCWSCDLAFRRQQGIPVLPSHPGLA